MNLVALIESHEHVCYRYRIAAFAAALNNQGWSVQASPLAKGLWSRTRQLQQTSAADVVLLQRKLLPCWQLALLRRQAKVLLYDVDDAVFCRDSNSKKPSKCPSRLLRFWSTIQAADGIAVGNHFLEQQASRFVDRERITFVPTCVNPSRYKPVSHTHNQNRPFRLGWIGSRSTLPALIALSEGLQAAAKRLGELELWVICDHFPEIPGVKIVACPWSQATEALHLAQVDVGVSFLPNHPWSDGKCGLKVLQYHASGLPTIANRRGVHMTMLGDEVTGLYADTAEEFAQAVERLATNVTLRQTLGWQGRKQVEESYSSELWGERFANWIEFEYAKATGKSPSTHLESVEDSRSVEVSPSPSIGPTTNLPVESASGTEVLAAVESS